jgi:hypothetical protein
VVATLNIKIPKEIASDFFILYLPMFTVRFTSCTTDLIHHGACDRWKILFLTPAPLRLGCDRVGTDEKGHDVWQETATSAN